MQFKEENAKVSIICRSGFSRELLAMMYSIRD